ncbi:transposase [Nocardioides houyundeii]|uniref:transposase n=1 Tax=Nocardioides houyundeii TaxID=2045452 RepID=UPI000C779D64|nr:transposase [Nocardioides houyundeii]
MSSSTPTKNSNTAEGIDPDFASLLTTHDIKEPNISAIVRLHPNLLAQLDAAFRRHHWLVKTTGVGEVLDRHCRSSNRGRKKAGLDGALYYALQLTAVFTTGQATIEQMYVVAQSLPLPTRIEFGIVVYKDKKKVRELTRKQLYTMTEGLGRNLSYTTDCLTDAERQLPHADQRAILQTRQAERHAVVTDFVTRLLKGTHLINIEHGTYAIDDTSIWAWSKAPHSSRHLGGGQDRPLADEDTADVPPHDSSRAAEAQDNATPGDVEDPDPDGTPDATEVKGEHKERQDPAPWLCPDAAWGGKTAKSGAQVGIYGYKAHVIVNTNDPAGKQALPVLIQALELTPANEDVVDVSLRLIDQIRARAPFVRLIGDRHYGYKRFDRWAMELWRRRIHQVLDLRADKPGVMDQYGSKVIDGRPHCPRMGAHLETLVPSDEPEKQTEFRQQIAEREKFALRMVKGPLASPGKTAAGEHDPKLGITRWQCPAVAGTVGCPLRPGTVGLARQAGAPVVPHPPEAEVDQDLPRCCTQQTIQIESGTPMKYLQEEYWGSKEWGLIYALRSAVEAVFGNIKNRGTEDVRRGFVQVVGLPLVTLAVAAAAACHNIRILEKHGRESGEQFASPLMNHPVDGELIESLVLRGDEVFEHLERTAA